ncbi:MAG: TolC family protein, partial [Xanthomonadaceae bacterium]|nr:TolC family protein [Xanthomonadaceae bacterium]
QRDSRADLLQAALARYRKAVLTGAAQVEIGLASLHTADQRLEHADAAVAASQRGLALNEKLQARDEADQLNLVAAELALGRVKLGQVQARLQHGLAFVGLYKALGGAPLPHLDAAAAAATGHQGS